VDLRELPLGLLEVALLVRVNGARELGLAGREELLLDLGVPLEAGQDLDLLGRRDDRVRDLRELLDPGCSGAPEPARRLELVGRGGRGRERGLGDRRRLDVALER